MPGSAAAFNEYHVSELLPESRCDIDGLQELYRKLADDEDMQPPLCALASISVPDDDLDLLFAACTDERQGIYIPGLPLSGLWPESGAQAWRRLSRPAQAVLGGIATAFVRTLRADISRTPGLRQAAGGGEVTLSNQRHAARKWHIDGSRTPSAKELLFERGLRRYVLSFGPETAELPAPTTQFWNGLLTSVAIERLSILGGMDALPNEERYTRAYSAGTIACFDSSLTPHRVPAMDGPRVFLSAAAVIDACRPPRLERARYEFSKNERRKG